MIYGRIVTEQQVQDLEGVFFDSDTFFHFVQDINSKWFLITSEQDDQDISNTEYAYLLQLPLEPYVAPTE